MQARGRRSRNYFCPIRGIDVVIALKSCSQKAHENAKTMLISNLRAVRHRELYL